MAENPFAKYAPPPSGGAAANPFAKFAAADDAAAATVAARPNGQKDFGIDWAQPAEAVRAAIAKLPEADRKDARKQWADAYVAKEHEASPTMMSIADKGRQFMRGTPVGSWLDELNAALPLGGGGGSDYDERKAYQDARDRHADDNSTVVGKLPVIGDVTAGGITKVAGGVVTAPLSPVLRLLKGNSVLPQMVNSGATGILYGAGYGAGEGGTTDERGKNAAVGAAMGGGLGILVPPVARGIGNTLEAGKRAVTKLPDELTGISPQAVERVAGAMEADRVPLVNGSPARPLPGSGAMPNGPSAGMARLLGPEGMLADMGPTLNAHTFGLTNSTGPQRSIIVDALEARKAGAKSRIDGDVTKALGAPVNVPETIQANLDHIRVHGGPLYDAFHNSPPAARTSMLESALSGADASGALAKAQSRMRIERIDPDAPHNFNRLLDYTRQFVDQDAKVALKNEKAVDHRMHSMLASDLNNAIDTALAPQNPAGSIYAQARGVAEHGLSFNSALEEGTKVFQKGLTPDELAVDLAKLTPHNQTAYRAGGREGVRQIMGNSATKFGDNGDSAAMTALGSSNAREKIAHIAGRPAADTIVNRLKTEGIFEGLRQKAVNNSQTAINQDARKLYPSVQQDMATPSPTVMGLAHKAVDVVLNAMTSGAITERNIRVATDAAKMLVAQGAERDAIARGLYAYSRQQGITNQQRTAVVRIANSVLMGTRGAAISSASDTRASTNR